MNSEKDKPPIYGEIEFTLPIAPVSQQANSEAKRMITESIQKITNSLEYILTGEIKVEFEWFIHEQLRYESDIAPDVDNILKPLIDGLCGIKGIIIDDCQIQAVTCYWVDWTRSDQKIVVRVKYLPDDYLRKKDLIFVQFSKGLCWPINQDLPNSALYEMLILVEKMIQKKEEWQSKTGDYYSAKRKLPIQRFFHRTRIHGFPVLKINEMLQNIAK